MTLESFWKKVVKITFAVIGIVALISLVWAILQINHHTFFSTMKFFGTAGFFILDLAGIILGVRSIKLFLGKR